MSFTAHKFYGPNGIGALYKRRGLVIEPQISGGASTTIYRSGTPTLGLAVSLDAALTKALAGQTPATPKCKGCMTVCWRAYSNTALCASTAPRMLCRISSMSA